MLHGVDLDVEELGDADLRRDALRHARHTGDGADVELLPETTHERGIGEVERGHVQLVGHVPLGFRDPHLLELHPCHQISSGPDATHRRGQQMRHVHAGWVTCTHLQPVRLADLDHGGATPGHHVDGGCLEPVSYTHLRAHETRHDLVCRL